MSAAGPWAAEAGSVPEVAFAVVGAARLEPAAVPRLRFPLRIDSGGRAVGSFVLEQLHQLAQHRYVTAYGVALVYAGLGEH